MPDSSGELESTVSADAVVDALDKDVSADSSPAEGVKDFRDVVDEALTGKEEPPASVSGEEGDSSKPKQESDDAPKSEEPQDPSEDELKQYSANAQNRIRELVDRRKDAEGRATELESQIQELQPRAEQMGKIEGFMQQNRISPAEFDNVMKITALIQTGEYGKALEVVTPIYRQLLEVSGNILPEELQERVRLGYITEADAHELHRERTNSRNAQDRETERAEEARQREQEQQNANLVTLLQNTGDAWDAEKATSDPDWSLKQELVTNEVELTLRRLSATPDQIPRTDAEVRKLLDGCLAAVEKRTGAFRTPKPATELRTGRPASTASRAKPATYMDAIDQALAG